MRPMGWAVESSSESHFGSLKFEKTGSEIQRGIDTRVEALSASISASESRITEICKRREIDATDILKDEDAEATNQKVGAYSTALSEQMQAKTALEKLNADMQQLRTETWGIQGARSEIARLTTVKKNIETARKFDLTFRELSALGF